PLRMGAGEGATVNVFLLPRKLDSKARVLPSHKYKPEINDTPRVIPPSPVVSLEQAKTKSKVELDLQLDSDTCIEGGYMKGSVVINIRSSKKGVPIYLGDGKVRVIGFEAPLSNISPFIHQVYASLADEEGFYPGKEGEYLLPFAMRLPPRQKNLPYIALVSIMLKHPRTNAKSIAHFYRTIEVWPLLDLGSVLAAAPSPLFATTSKSLSSGSSGTIELTASLHRATWVAGQRCYIKLSVTNNSTKRKVRTLTLSLVRSETVFKPHVGASIESFTSHVSDEAHPYQSSTVKRIVARSTLEAGENASVKHATAKGWWTGVNPGTSLDFNHYLLIPVGYVVDVTIGTGSLASETAVQIPIQIINHISIDPPPVFELPESFRNISLAYPATLTKPHGDKPYQGPSPSQS
ncbi:9232_t:CDS:2, partial [Acaulospora colombiana]